MPHVQHGSVGASADSTQASWPLEPLFQHIRPHSPCRAKEHGVKKINEKLWPRKDTSAPSVSKLTHAASACLWPEVYLCVHISIHHWRTSP